MRPANASQSGSPTSETRPPDDPATHRDPAREWWRALPLDRAVWVHGAGLLDFETAFEALPGHAPAIVVFRDLSGDSVQAAITKVCHDLDAVVRKLYPAWLEGAERIEGRSRPARRAVSELCRQQAGRDGDYANFLADIADRSLTGRDYRGRLIDEVRIEELVRLLARSYGATAAALPIHVESDVSAEQREILTATGRWLAAHGRVGVWLVGAGPSDLPLVTVTLPLAAVDGPATAVTTEQEHPPGVAFPALAGRPHPGSPAELRLERGLRRFGWAQGRRWNHTMQISVLSRPIRVDLVWEAERCIVEIDGRDHRLERKFAKDHRRDVALHLRGYTVLRFTNEQIYHDLGLALRQIEQFLQSRRS